MKGFAWWKGTGRPWERGRFWRVKKDMAREIFVIAGLGNPGAEYAHTRHNAGFDTMDLLAERLGVQIGRKMLGGLLGETLAGEKKIVLCKPQTFMNASGECVEKLLQWYHVEPDHLLVIYDDIDLAPGTVRMRRQGGPGTHNGMRDIVARLNRQDFARLRIGTGDRPAGQDLVGWVLGRPAGDERERMERAFAAAAECAADWVENGIDHAMRLCAEKGKEEKQE